MTFSLSSYHDILIEQQQRGSPRHRLLAHCCDLKKNAVDMHEGRTTRERAQSALAQNGSRRMTVNSRTLGMVLFCTALAVCSVVVNPGPTAAVEVGEPAPDFTLASTTGADISLSDFKGKKFVFLEFYGADFAPT
jgi:hypothetical protein